MPAPPDLAGLVRPFLDRVRPDANELPDPVGEDFTSPGLGGGLALPGRVRGLLLQLAETERKIARAFEGQRGAVTQQFISRGLSNSTAHDSKLRELHRAEEADRSRSREQWYRGLAPPEQVAFDNYCLAVAEPVLLPLFLPDGPPCLRGPLARLALEYAALVRRFAARRKEVDKSLAHRGLGNRTVVESVLRGFASDDEEATSRLIGRWLRERTPEQEPGLDSSGAGPSRARTVPNERARRGHPPLTPERLAMYRGIKERWERAKGAGVSKDQFCRDDPISRETLETALRTCRKEARGR